MQATSKRYVGHEARGNSSSNCQCSADKFELFVCVDGQASAEYHIILYLFSDQKLGSLEPPLINVFTMQWFLTLFCTCLPTSCVLRVWDLVLIEGSDILLRTALAIWALLAE